MTYNEFYNQINSMTIEQRNSNQTYRNELKNRVYDKANSIKGYEKLSLSQKEAINNLVYKMYEHYLGEKFVSDHYEIFNNQTAGNPVYKQYREMEDNDQYLAHGSSATFKALEKKGFIQFVEDGKLSIDVITPNFEIDFSDIKLNL